ncbi:MAG: TROVE domain-containing protein, partial [Synergistaceae bacterium]|nr:TROVE domain-containing protein [Synergistaceae bacterium]
MAQNFYTQALQATQQEPVFGKNMVRNNAGGYVFQVSPETRLDRFLILGSDSGSFYCNAREMTIDNAKAIMEIIEKAGTYVVARTVEISQSGRAPRNDSALFVLAICFAIGDADTKKAAKAALHTVARTGTHFFLFLQYVTTMRGWGRALKTAVANWYECKNSSDLAYQLAKYRNREGWQHHDVLNMAHIKSQDSEKQALFQMIVDDGQANLDKKALLDLVDRYTLQEQMPSPDYYRLCRNTDKLKIAELISVIQKFRLPHEVIPSEALGEPGIWKALLQAGMPMTAMIRNIGRIASKKIFDDSVYIDILRNRLTNPDNLIKARIHPLNLLTAWRTYSSSHGQKGKLAWKVDRRVMDILEDAFYLSFKTIESTGKRIFIGLDVSGSMGSTAWNGLSAREISAVMCMAVVRSEPDYIIKAFDHELCDVEFGKNSSLDEVLREISHMNFGNTDCALPMVYAR